MVLAESKDFEAAPRVELRARFERDCLSAVKQNKHRTSFEKLKVDGLILMTADKYFFHLTLTSWLLDSLLSESLLELQI